MNIANQQVSMSGKILLYIYRKPGWSVAKIQDNQGDVQIIVGEFGTLEPGDRATFFGQHVVNQRYGKQFKVLRYEQNEHEIESSYIKVLSSGRFPGIGKGLAERIYRAFEGRVDEVLSNNPEELATVKGITKAKAEQIQEIWVEQAGELKLLRLFAQVGIRSGKITSLLETAISDPYKYIEDNPYRVLNYPLFTWEDAEKLGRYFNVDLSDEHRLQGAAIFSVQQICRSSANTMCDLQALHGKMIELSQAPMDAINKAIAESYESLISIDYDGELMIALRSFFKVEQELSNNIKTKIAFKPREYVLKHAIDPMLTQSQQQAVRNSFESSISIITGGPGTGKTTTVREIVSQAKELGLKISLCAPTGRAAKQLEKVTGCKAKTVHSLLSISPGSDSDMLSAGKDMNNPLESDLIICDEWSMADMFLTYSLFQAVAEQTRIVFVGDPDQLPSIGPGCVLRDLIQSNIPSQVLEYNHRQQEGSEINDLAHDIKNNRLKELQSYGGSVHCFPAVGEDTVTIINRLVSEVLPKKYGYNIDDIQVIAPVYKSPTGITKLNSVLQATVNPPSLEGGNRDSIASMRVGDRVMVTKNHTELDVANGDIGTVTEIVTSPQMVEVTIAGRAVQFEDENIELLTLAWAISVHKSQGGEWPVIVMNVDASNDFMLTKQLVYTAFTRAKERLILVGQNQSLPGIIAGNLRRHRERKTVLSRLLPRKDGVEQTPPRVISISELGVILGV